MTEYPVAWSRWAEGYDHGHEDGYKEGYADGYADAQAALAPDPPEIDVDQARMKGATWPPTSGS